MVLSVDHPIDKRHSVGTPAHNPLPELATMEQQSPPNDRSLGMGSPVADLVISGWKPVSQIISFVFPHSTTFLRNSIEQL
jgi:hypothetical protein